MTPRRPDPRDPRGQILVIVAAGMLVFIAMVGLVIDGGNAWGQQRETQNAADSAAKAGAVSSSTTSAAPPMTDGDVGCAVEDAAADNDAEIESAEYTNHEGAPYDPSVPVGGCGAGGGIPPGRQGVRAVATKDFDTYLMTVVGVSELTATTDATAVVGQVETMCPLSVGCAVLPVTFPRTMDTCDGTNSRIVGQDEWELLDPEEDTLDATNLVIVPLCTTGPGSVGWLDFGCGNLAQTITHPENCEVSFPIPAWLDTQSGNANNLETELNDYAGTEPGVAGGGRRGPVGADPRLHLPRRRGRSPADHVLPDAIRPGRRTATTCTTTCRTGPDSSSTTRSSVGTTTSATTAPARRPPAATGRRAA